jgi:hypothetical protein
MKRLIVRQGLFVSITLIAVLWLLPTHVQARDRKDGPKVIYPDLEWELTEDQNVGVLKVCRDGIRYVHLEYARGAGGFSILLIVAPDNEEVFVADIDHDMPDDAYTGDPEGRTVWWDEFTTLWPRPLEPGERIRIQGINPSETVHAVEDCFLEERNKPAPPPEPPPPAPQPPEPQPSAPQPEPQPEPTALEFSATATQLQAGQCTNLRWNVENVQALWVYPKGARYNDYGVQGQGGREVCPTTTTTYEMRILLRNDQVEIRQVHVEVLAAPVAAAVPATTTTSTAPPPTNETTNQTPPPASARRATARITAATLNVREGAGADFPIIAKVYAGEVYYVAARDATGAWLQLAIPGAPNNTGWIATRFATVSTPVANLPVYGASTATTSNKATGGQVAAPVQPSANSATVGPLITDFERWGAWRRGDERWGDFTQSGEEVHGGKFAGRLDYDFPANVPNNYVVFRQVLPMPGTPTALSLWVYGDGSEHFLNLWVQDAQNQLWQFGFGQIKHSGWRQMVAPLDLNLGWPNQPVGTASTAQPVYPLKFYAFVLDSQRDDVASQGVIYVDDLAVDAQ